jgi:hypothetical protein
MVANDHDRYLPFGILAVQMAPRGAVEILWLYSIPQRR